MAGNVTPACHHRPMAFGQSAGPPAGHRQIERLLELLAAEGYGDFREARGAFGLNQRQAGGKFTVDEADDLIRQLEDAEFIRDGGDQPPAAAPKLVPPKQSRAERAAADLTDEVLAAELQSRGWIVVAP